mmetsp:Transcript_111180/g.325213  ORF Transcript_111180/g.325213 Transcript_111180/m.325213 type:complete len:347 (+) Transcript_111180:50-1090(+)
MAPLTHVILLCCAAQLVAASRARSSGAAGRQFLAGGSDLRPDLAAGLLASLEDEWKSQAAAFVACNGTEGSPCETSSTAFTASCSKVVSAVVKGSSGNRATVADYMGEVCGEATLQGWKRDHCHGFKQALMSFMSADDYSNRENLDVAGLCSGLWQGFSKEELALHKLELERQEKAREEAAKKAAEEAAAEKKRQEEAAKFAAEEAKKRAEEEARRKAEEARQKAEEEKRHAEEKRRMEEEEVARQAQEAKRQAEEAAARLEAKREEAAREAEEARRKLEVAQAAALKIHQLHAPANSSGAAGSGQATESNTSAVNSTAATANLTGQVPVGNSTNATVAALNATKK